MSCMEDKIRNKVKSAYEGIALEEELKSQAKKRLLAKARSRRKGSNKIYKMAAAAAVAALLVVGNIFLIQMNMTHERKVPATESTSFTGETESESTVQTTALDSIENLKELEDFAWTPNSVVRELENNFYVAILCYDENGEECLPKSNMSARIEYAYFLFDDAGMMLKQYRQSFQIESGQWKSIGAVFMNGDWYEVTDTKKDGAEHYYEILNVTSPEKSSYARIPEDEETIYRISADTFYFARYAEDGNGYMEVGMLDNDYYGQIKDFSMVHSRQDLEKLIAQPEVYSVKFLDDMYFIVLPYRQNRRCSLLEQADSIDIGTYKTDNDEIAGSWVSMHEAENSVVESIGVSNYDGSFYLISKEKDTEKYRITALFENYEEHFYCDEGICPGVYSNADFFAILVTEGGNSYWQIGSDLKATTDYSPKGYCQKHGWDEQCTSDMTVRDIYVTRNWIGKSVSKFIGLERFFGEPVQTEFETGDKDGMGDPENAYQVNNYYECANFNVSSEPDSDEIISVSLIGNHNYVTEDVWIGMSMAEVQSKMGMDDSAFFEKGGYMYSYLERDGYLYEFIYVEEAVGANLPPYASYPKPEYVLYYAKISDAEKIMDSSVKSLGESMFGDFHSLEEGKN